ncbi:methyltransferase [Shewanella sp. SR44-3]|uniref:tRNA1(Val) (adenine(37)-N6)-methyltransferase n=1 Tax=Shewanella sp. SR44-3 TaxID=2760936 RepID=UPI0015F7F0A1|nr:methyltransferase [Shewanella sp. SR44-3]
MAFTFKQFHIDDGQCAMAVSTDGVLLGAYAPLTKAKSILDIGAGSGLLSLMAAQRTQAECQIVAIELDAKAARACQGNIANSPWHTRIKVINSSIQAYCDDRTHKLKASHDASINPSQQFEHIISNPPFFEQGPLSQSTHRATARHTHNLPFEALFNAIKGLLAPQGVSTIILPLQSLNSATAAYLAAGLELSDQCLIASVKGKTPYRVILCLQHSGAGREPLQLAVGESQYLSILKRQLQGEENSLYIRDTQGEYGPEMARICKDFYLKL